MKNPIVQLTKLLSTPIAKRSDLWRTVRKHHLEIEDYCKYCGSTKDLEVHHVSPYHLDPAHELDPSNLITLCESIGVQCHLKQGHLGDWKNINPNVREVAVYIPKEN